MKKALLLFIAGHGYGHLSRMRHVIQEFEQQNQGAYSLLVVGDFDEAFFSSFEFLQTRLIRIAHDVGLVQPDSLTIDYTATLARLKSLYSKKEELFQKIMKEVGNASVAAVLSDTSSMGLELADRLNVPGYLVGNFTWADIYRDLLEEAPGFEAFIPEIEKQYLYAEKCFVLPLNTDMKPYPEEKKKGIPLIAPLPSRMAIEEFESRVGRSVSGYKRRVLISFGGFNFQNLPADIIRRMEDTLFITTRAKAGVKADNLVEIETVHQDYAGIIKHSDVIITKAGYGILMDALVHQKPLVHTDRGRFAEYPILRNWLDQSYPSVFLPQEDFRAGRWEYALNQAFSLKLPFPEVALNGALVLASFIDQKIKDGTCSGA